MSLLRAVRHLIKGGQETVVKASHTFRRSQSNTPESTWRPFNPASSQLSTRKAPLQGRNPFQAFDRPPSFSFPYNAAEIAMDKRRRIAAKNFARKRQRIKETSTSELKLEGSNEEVLAFEVEDLLKQARPDDQQATSEGSSSSGDVVDHQPSSVPQPFVPSDFLGKEIELDIVMLSSTGDGLAYTENKDHIIVVPFCVPGDRVLARPYQPKLLHTQADFIKLITPSPRRADTVPKCKHFGTCSGCQFQMLPYSAQLDHKRDIVQRAYQKFSGLKPEQMPEILPTMGSPLQFGYRTKLSPHFDGPRGWKKGITTYYMEKPAMGFNAKGTRKVLDIETCPISAEIVQEGLKIERERVAKEWKEYTNGKTILIRESTERQLRSSRNADDNLNKTLMDLNIDPAAEPNQKELIFDAKTGAPTLELTYPTYRDYKTYVSDERAQAIEYVTVTVSPPDPEKSLSADVTSTANGTNAQQTEPLKTRTYTFDNTAGAFFQNNNSILNPFTSYIYQHCLPKPANSRPRIKYLLDAYTGTGLFAHVLSPLFTSTLGIDIDARGIASARHNANLNGLGRKLGFIDASAENLFADVPFPSEESLCVIDPPRKGCSLEFLRQLRAFGVGRVVYVSCNVHSQARDVGILVNGEEGEESGEKKMWKYEIEQVKGFDFFPQTGHVEGVCILNRVEA